MNASLLFFYLGIAASYLVIRPLATVVHECGHVAALLLLGMRGEIRVFLGSLGDGKRSLRIQAGRICWALHPRLLLMRGSLSDYDQPLQPRSLAMVALSGPLASLCMVAVTFAMALSPWSVGPMRAVLILASIIPALDVVLSLMYRYEPILLSNARITANDGQVLGWLLRFGQATDRYLHARWLFEKDCYAEAATAIAALLQAGHTEKLLYEYQIYSLLMLQQPHAAMDAHGALAKAHLDLDAFDDCLHALALEQLGKHDAAGKVLDLAIAKAPGHHEARNHRAYRALQSGHLEVAWSDLDQALRSHPEFAAALNNRGALRLSRMELPQARLDLQSALRHDHENPYIHRNWAMLLALEGDAAGAASAFESARLLGLRADDRLIGQQPS
jgi:Flp pilus assembly protein TadD